MTRTVSDTSIGIVAVLVLALIAGAYFLGAHQAAFAGPRFVPAHDMRGFVFDNKTAQMCWALAPETNPSLPKPSPDSEKPNSFSFLNPPQEPGIPTCKSLL
jgi:hypothetical protein